MSSCAPYESLAEIDSPARNRAARRATLLFRCPQEQVAYRGRTPPPAARGADATRIERRSNFSQRGPTGCLNFADHWHDVDGKPIGRCAVGCQMAAALSSTIAVALAIAES